MLENKDELLQFLSHQLKTIEEKKEKNKRNIKPFRGFCYNDPLNNQYAIAQIQFENAIDRKDNYSMILTNQTCDSFGANLEGNADKKTLVEAMDIVCKDKASMNNVINCLNRLKSITRKSFSCPKKGEVFIKLFERLYREALDNKNSIIGDMYINAIKELEIIFTEKFASLYSNNINYDKATDIINEMIDLVENDRIMNIDDKKKNIIHNFLKLNHHDIGLFCLIEGYNNKLIDDQKRQEKSGSKMQPVDNYIPVNSPEYIKILKDMNFEIDKKVNIYKEFLADITKLLETDDFENPKLIDDFKNILTEANKSNNKELLIKILRVVLADNPSYKPFLEIISPILNLSINNKEIRRFNGFMEFKNIKFNNPIKKPKSFDDILELFEFCGSMVKIVSVKGNNKIADKIINMYDSVLIDVASEIINVAKRTIENKKKYELTHIDMKNIINGLENNEKIILTDEKNLRETNLGFTENDPKEAREFIPLLLLEVEEFNKEIEIFELKKTRKRAKLARTNIIKVMKKDGYKVATKKLKEKVSSIEDNLTLQVLNYLLDIESDKARYESYYDGGDVPFYQNKESNFYYLLIKLACDCTDYIGKKTGNYHYDGVATKEMLEKIK